MQGSPHSTRVVFSVTNCICFDQRVLKIAETVRQLNCRVTIIGRRLGSCCDSDSVQFRTKRFRMLFKRGFLFYSFFNIRLFFFLLIHKYDLLVANDLDTLLPNFLVSKLKRIPLVYDSHEYFTGVPEIQGRPFVKWVWTLIEKMTFPRLKNVMTVSESIAGQYDSEYGLRPVVVRNCAPSSAEIYPLTKKELQVPDDHLLIILQGGGINIDRGGEELIEAVSRLEKVYLIIAGSGDIIDSLKGQALRLNISGSVRFIPKQPWKLLMKYTKAADAGLTLDKDTNMNYRFSLPNKLFDYISAGIPVIAGDLPEVKNIIDEYSCGILISSITPEAITKAIMKLSDDRSLLDVLKRNAVAASVLLTWETESKKVIDFYSKVLNIK